MDDRIRIANLRIGTPFSGDNAPAVRYYLEDHLSNCSFTLETTGTLFSREEYFPFGETSFGSFAKKRYRFCGKERDEESGLYYYGARYYAPWTCRFVSLDPLAGNYPFYTPYQNAGNQPINLIDFKGLAPQNNSKYPSSGPLAPSNPDITPNQQSGGAVIYGDESLKQRFKTLLQTRTGYVFTDVNGQLAITGNVADYDPTKYSQELRQSVEALVIFSEDTIPFYLVDSGNSIYFDDYLGGTLDIGDFEKISNPELASAKLGHIFEERMAMMKPFKYSYIVNTYNSNNGGLTGNQRFSFKSEYKKSHLKEANIKDAVIFNELNGASINPKIEIHDLKDRATDKTGILATGWVYGNDVYFIFFEGTTKHTNIRPIIGSRKGSITEITQNHENDKILYYLDNTSK